jgi:transcriptional regulator with XRE-family HTH domain
VGKVEQYLRATTNAELARKTGLSEGFVSRVLRGQRRGRIDNLVRLADVLGVTLDELHQYLKKLEKPGPRYGWQDAQKVTKQAGEAA